jgi:hypothetical protein
MAIGPASVLIRLSTTACARSAMRKREQQKQIPMGHEVDLCRNDGAARS